MKDLRDNATILYFITMICPVVGVILLCTSSKIKKSEKVIFSIMGTLTFALILTMFLK